MQKKKTQPSPALLSSLYRPSPVRQAGWPPSGYHTTHTQAHIRADTIPHLHAHSDIQYTLHEFPNIVMLFIAVTTTLACPLPSAPKLHVGSSEGVSRVPVRSRPSVTPSLRWRGDESERKRERGEGDVFPPGAL